MGTRIGRATRQERVDEPARLGKAGRRSVLTHFSNAHETAIAHTSFKTGFCARGLRSRDSGKTSSVYAIPTGVGSGKAVLIEHENRPNNPTLWTWLVTHYVRGRWAPLVCAIPAKRHMHSTQMVGRHAACSYMTAPMYGEQVKVSWYVAESMPYTYARSE